MVISPLEGRDEPPNGMAVGYLEQLFGNPGIVSLVEQQLRQRIAAMAQAVAPTAKKTVPRRISTTSPRSVSRAASAVFMPFI